MFSRTLQTDPDPVGYTDPLRIVSATLKAILKAKHKHHILCFLILNIHNNMYTVYYSHSQHGLTMFCKIKPMAMLAVCVSTGLPALKANYITKPS